MAEALALFRFLHFAALMAAFGAAAFACYAAAPAPAGTVRHAALVALASGLAMLPVTAARMAGENAAAFDPQILRAVLFDTGFGHVWCLHLALLIPPAVVPRGPLAALFAAAALAGLGWVGHPAGHGLAVNQAVHLLAAGAWLGGLWPLSRLLLQARRSGDEAAVGRLREVLSRFSRMGYAAVALILASGIVDTVALVGSARAFSDTAYGRLLALKLALVAAMLALAATNRFRLVPRLARGGAALAPLARAALAELGLGLAVLAAVAVLGTWPPAAG